MPASRGRALTADDVVILPAFGVTVDELIRLDAVGCTLVDTTCGSVLNVWKNVKRYAQDGFTSVIHGKHWHEETRATASQAVQTPGRPLPRRARSRRGRHWSATSSPAAPARRTRAALLEQFRDAVSPGFDPDLHLERIGCANQTTMLSSESFAIGEMFREAIRARDGEAGVAERFRAFDTICSATQDRQDAVERMLADHAARPDARHRRLQQQQHLQPGPYLRRPGADVTTSPIPTAWSAPTPSAIATSPPRPSSSPATGCPAAGP